MAGRTPVSQISSEIDPEMALEISSARQTEILRKMLEQKKKESEQLTEEHGFARNIQGNFEDFMRAVVRLPEDDGKMDGQSAFDHYILRESALRIRAREDEMYYGTTFGLTLVSVGNARAGGPFI